MRIRTNNIFFFVLMTSREFFNAVVNFHIKQEKYPQFLFIQKTNKHHFYTFLKHLTNNKEKINFSLGLESPLKDYNTAVITIKHVSSFVNKVEIPCNFKEIFDLIDKCRYVFYGYDGRISFFSHNMKKFSNKKSWIFPPKI